MRDLTDVRYQRSASALSRRVGADMLVTTVGGMDVHELSGGASAIWADLSTPRTLPALVERLAAEHRTEPAEIAPQVESCLDMFTALGVVEEVQDSDL